MALFQFLFQIYFPYEVLKTYNNNDTNFFGEWKHLQGTHLQMLVHYYLFGQLQTVYRNMAGS